MIKVVLICIVFTLISCDQITGSDNNVLYNENLLNIRVIQSTPGRKKDKYYLKSNNPYLSQDFVKEIHKNIEGDIILVKSFQTEKESWVIRKDSSFTYRIIEINVKERSINKIEYEKYLLEKEIKKTWESP